MSILRVSRMGHPVLRQSATAIDPTQIKHPDLQRLVDDMIDTMSDYEGIGLAAPQVFQSLRLIVLGVPNTDPEDENSIPLTVLFNPEFAAMSEEVTSGWEGCLSIPDVRGVVPRSTSVTVRAFDREGQSITFEARDFFARVLQHEVDHLDGVLFLDRMEDLDTLSFLEEYQRYWIEEGEEDEGDEGDD
ncbi:MAG: peptide deformylase [Planctomycetota bacterium]|jgi:peptide deformylase